MVWTVNRAERMREFAAWGVDAIISDETERAAQVCARLLDIKYPEKRSRSLDLELGGGKGVFVLLFGEIGMLRYIGRN